LEDLNDTETKQKEAFLYNKTKPISKSLAVENISLYYNGRGHENYLLVAIITFLALLTLTYFMNYKYDYTPINFLVININSLTQYYFLNFISFVVYITFIFSSSSFINFINKYKFIDNIMSNINIENIDNFYIQKLVFNKVVPSSNTTLLLLSINTLFILISTFMVFKHNLLSPTPLILSSIITFIISLYYTKSIDRTQIRELLNP